MMITAPDPASHRSRHSLVQAIQTSTYFLPALALSACAPFISTGAQVQVKPEIASCAELKDEAIVAQAEMCSAHIGCVYVLNVQKTCARAKGYLERLQTAIGEGTRTFFGSYRKEVTPDAIFTAELGGDERASVRMLDAIPTSQRRSQEIAAKVRDVGTGDTLTGSASDGGSWVYYGQTQNGKADGVGTRIFSNGELQRGPFVQDNRTGAGDVLYSTGGRYIGDLTSGQRSGQGAYIYKNGTKQEGSFSGGEIVSGTTYRPDGKVSEKGNYDKAGKLSFGQRFDTEGVPTVVNVRLEQEAAARAAAAAEKQRKLDEQQRKLDEAQRQREAAAQAEQQFRASLQTMNPGQLFAKADELNAQGDRTRAREVQRTLMSRFPDHPLATTAARQMAGESGGGASTGRSSITTGDAVTPSRSAGGRLSSQQCEAMKQSVIATKVPPNASITASTETVMFMTKTVLDMIAADCPTEPGVTPAQIEAERKMRQQQYAAAESACNAVQSGGRRCVPQAHVAAVSMSPPPAPSRTSGSSQSGTIAYDPVTGKCYPEGSQECKNVPGTTSDSRSGGSSGRGIRTAR